MGPLVGWLDAFLIDPGSLLLIFSLQVVTDAGSSTNDASSLEVNIGHFSILSIEDLGNFFERRLEKWEKNGQPMLETGESAQSE